MVEILNRSAKKIKVLEFFVVFLYTAPYKTKAGQNRARRLHIAPCKPSINLPQITFDLSMWPLTSLAYCTYIYYPNLIATGFQLSKIMRNIMFRVNFFCTFFIMDGPHGRTDGQQLAYDSLHTKLVPQGQTK